MDTNFTTNYYFTLYCCVLLKLQILIITFQYQGIPFNVIKNYIIDNPQQIKQFILV